MNGNPRDTNPRELAHGELEEVLEAHSAWLETNGKEGKRAVFFQAYLNKAYLQGVDLRGADMRQASLQEAEMQLANLFRANLEAANLQKANMYKTCFVNRSLII